MAGEEYAPKVHFDGPDELVVEDGGAITVKSGGTITNGGDVFTSFDVDDVSIEVNGSVELAVIVDDSTIEIDETNGVQVKDAGITLAKLASDVTDILNLLVNLPTENVAAPAIWLDGTTLKVGTAGE